MLERMEQWIFKSGWVIAFALICFGLYEQGMTLTTHDFTRLQHQFNALQEEHKQLEEQNHLLKLRINSHSDPDWLELVLMRGMGLVPENQTKVYFTERRSWNP